MRIVNPTTGRAYLEKRRRRFNELGQPCALTFSCYRRLPFLAREPVREWFCDALQVARKVIAHLKRHAPDWLPRLAVREGKRLRHRVWQPGGGHDRNISTAAALGGEIDYLHINPVRRGLVAKVEDWEWSSARRFLGIRPVKIAMDGKVLTELSRDGDLTTVMKRTGIGEIVQ